LDLSRLHHERGGPEEREPNVVSRLAERADRILSDGDVETTRESVACRELDPLLGRDTGEDDARDAACA